MMDDAAGSPGMTRRAFLTAAVAAASGCTGGSSRSLSSAGKPVPGGPRTTPNPEVQYPSGYVGPVASHKGPVTTEPARLRVVQIQDPVVGDWAKNHFTKWYEERTNVRVDWDIVPGGDDTPTKVNAMLSSGDLPDIFMTGFTPSQINLFGRDQGLFIALDDLIERYGTETRRLFRSYPVTKQISTAPDGHIYALPSVNDCFHCQGSISRTWIYQPWLDELGLDLPETTDELEDVLRAFKDRDPNGDGEPTEIPLTADVDSPLDVYFMTPFLYNPGQPWLVLDDDRVDVVYNKPGWREGLRWMHKLYADGLIDPDCFTQSNEQLQRIGNSSPTVAGAVRAFFYGTFMEIDESNPIYRDYVALPPMKGPDGTRTAGWDYYDAVATAGKVVITRASKIPEIAFMWADGQYELETTIRTYAGDHDTNWWWAQPGEPGLNGRQGIYKLKDSPPPTGQSWNQNGLMFNAFDLRMSLVSMPGHRTLEQPLHQQTEKAYYPYRVAKPRQLPPLYMDFDAAGAIADMEVTLTEFVRQQTALFTRGDPDPNDDTDWDDYLDTLDKIGLPDYLRIYQQAFDAQH